MNKSCSSLRWQRVGPGSASLIQLILDQAPSYRMNVDGKSEDPTAAIDSLTTLPPGCSPEQKYFLMLFEDQHPVGVADVILNFPEERCAYLGLLLLIESRQRGGLGAQAYRELERWIQTELKSSKIRLSLVDANPVQFFWEKMGFALTGESKVWSSGPVTSTTRLMEKRFPGSAK